VNFRPQNQLEVEIREYSKNATDAKLLELEQAMWDTTNSLVAIALFHMIVDFKNLHSVEVLRRYGLYLKCNEALFKAGFPDRKAVVENITAFLDTKK
jgi:hypothetical protein